MGGCYADEPRYLQRQWDEKKNEACVRATQCSVVLVSIKNGEKKECRYTESWLVLI
jgi:hypothetical protein